MVPTQSAKQTTGAELANARSTAHLRYDGSGSVGIARATKGDVTPAGEKFCEILQRLTGTSSPTTSVKSED
jgi:hypothetical protein